MTLERTKAPRPAARAEGHRSPVIRPSSLGAVAALTLLICAAHATADPTPPGPLALAAAPPAYLPRYDVEIDLDVAGHEAHVVMRATWTNPHPATPAEELVFNAHSHYIVPDGQIGFMAKMLEILRMYPGESLGERIPALGINRITLPGSAAELPFRFEGDTNTTLVVPLARPVGPGQSITVLFDITMRLPPKQGRWGQRREVTYLSNWLPVFAFYGDKAPKGAELAAATAPVAGKASWQPTPFIPWHQPFFNEACNYHVRVALPADQKVACTGSIVERVVLPDGRQRLEILAPAVRDFAFLCSARYKVFEGEVTVAPGMAPVRIHVLAFPEHEFYARELLRSSVRALATYSRWFGAYPWQDFTIAEAFFGWNGNECANLVMIDERVFGMPHLANGYAEYLISHEICHQWWYNLVGTNGYSETWMDESMANYFSHRLLNEAVGRNNSLMHYPSGLEWLPNIRRDDYRSSGMYSTFAKGESGPVVRDMKDFGHLIDLFNHCYDKGSRIVGMIEEQLGEAAFMDFMRIVAARYRHRILRVADFRRELELYTGKSWQDFFHRWLYCAGLSDWSIKKVKVEPPPDCAVRPDNGLFGWRRNLIVCRGADDDAPRPSNTRVTVWLRQGRDYDEQTTLGFALPHCEGYSVRVPILPHAGSYKVDEPPATVTVEKGEDGHTLVRVEVLLPAEPTQIAVDPDQVLVDGDPSNNFWKTPVRWRFAPMYSFLEETDLTNAYDRWNFIFGPWVYGASYNDSWYTRSTMIGLRAGAYRTQDFSGGFYTAYRTDYRDILAGFDAVWDHWPFPRTQAGLNYERRLFEFYSGDNEAQRGVAWARYIFQYGSSLYLLPMHYAETFVAYQDNFLPFPKQTNGEGVRYDRTSTLGLHYRLNYLTPYWDPEGGFQFDVYYEGGVAALPNEVGMQKLSSQFTVVKGLPDLSRELPDVPWLSDVARPILSWLGDTRLAVRAYGATSAPARGEFFTLGGSQMFRGFDLSQRQGSTLWVGSAEWRVPLAKGITVDAVDHVMSCRNIFGAVFYDAGNAYVNQRTTGPVAQAVGAGLRFDVTWFGFVERTTLRVDVARTLDSNAPTQIWFGLNQPF